jgi:enoyl-CoA hydratase
VRGGDPLCRVGRWGLLESHLISFERPFIPLIWRPTTSDWRLTMPTSLLFELSDGIARITLNRPDKLNALNATVIAELGDAVTRVETDAAVRAVILTGAGPKAFVAGADISELAEQTPLVGKARSTQGQLVFRRLERCGKPVIAAVNGFALGGGCELAMACHIRLASENAKFGQPEVKLGIAPGYGGTARLPRLVGRGRALELLLTGTMIDAAEAYRIGLVNRVVPADRLLDEAEALARAILENGPLAIRACLETVDAGLDSSLDQALLLESDQFGLLSASSDIREGTRAFLEKRKPTFEGL